MEILAIVCIVVGIVLTVINAYIATSLLSRLARMEVRVSILSELAKDANARSIESEITVKAMEKSTHSVQYVPLELDKKAEEEIETYREEYAQELEEVMPFFASTDEDKKVRGL